MADRSFQRSQYAGRPLGEPERRRLERARELCAPEPFSLHLANFNRRRRSTRATEMPAELKATKLEAKSQYLARKASAASPPPPGP